MPEEFDTKQLDTTTAQDAARVALGLMLVTAGTSHLTFARKEFRAQVPDWVPLDTDTVVVQSGIVEIALGSSLIFLPLLLPRQKTLLGRVAGAFFAAVFPGNIAQYTHHRDGFGLDTDGKRFARLFFQPLLVAWALWSTGALRRGRQNARLGSGSPRRRSTGYLLKGLWGLRGLCWVWARRRLQRSLRLR